MKKAIVIIFLFVVMVGTVWLLRFSSAPDLLDVNMAQLKTSQWHLPDGVIARIGKGTVNDLVYSPDSTMLAVASSTGTWLYDTHSGNEVALLTMDGEGTNTVAFSADGKKLATGCGNNLVRLWNVETRSLIHTFLGYNYLGYDSEIKGLHFNADGNTLMGWSDYGMYIWDIEKRVFERDLNMHFGRQTDVAFQSR